MATCSRTTQDELDYRFDGMHKLVSQIHNREDILKGRSSIIEKSCIMLFTKGNLTRIWRTLPQFLNLDIHTIILDDTGSDCLRRIIKDVDSKSNIEYHGLKEQAMTLDKLHKITDQAQMFFCPFGEKYWTLGYCRNYALVLAKLLGFRRVIMIDDDIIFKGTKRIFNILSALSRFDIVGARTTGMPDDSVVGHIIRALGLQPDEFISGQFVGIDTDSMDYYFPNIYNEDWIFFLFQTANTSLGRISEVEQLIYDPFRDFRRKSLFQEFGEIAVDGVFEAVVAKKEMSLLNAKDFWTNVCRERAKLLKELTGAVKSHPNRRTFEMILKGLQRYHLSIHPEQFRLFFGNYLESLSSWHTLLSTLSKYGEIEEN